MDLVFRISRPLRWLIAQRCGGGTQKAFNFSEWPTDPKSIAKKLDRINEMLDYRDMPP